jgi:hypothetical protein
MNVHRGSYLDLEMPIFVNFFKIYLGAIHSLLSKSIDFKNTHFHIPRPENTRIVVVVNTAPANTGIISAILHYQFGNFKCAVKQTSFSRNCILYPALASTSTLSVKWASYYVL